MIVLKQTKMRIYGYFSPRAVSGFWRYKSYAGIPWGSLERWCQMRVFSLDRYIFRMKFPTEFTYQNSHGFVQFASDTC